MQFGHSPQGFPAAMRTRLPGAQCSGTPSPTCSMTPAGSCPGVTRSSGAGSVPSMRWTSDRQIPHACTRTRTSPGPGSGSGSSPTSSRRLVESKTAARTCATYLSAAARGVRSISSRVPLAMKLSCAFATSPESHEHAAVAESLGYERAYFYDSPALYPDVWVQLCRAAERTERIGLRPGVLVPGHRHPMTNAAAIAQLVELAGEDRVTVAVGSGFTGRMAMGQRALRWNFVADYVRTLQALLRGDVVSWDGAPIQMLHSPGMAPERPINVRWLIGAGGPKGVAVARELGDGVFTAGTDPPPGFDWSVALVPGTVLGEGESADSKRARAAAGHAGSVMLHFAYEHSLLPEEQLREWLAAYENVPEDRRHLA